MKPKQAATVLITGTSSGFGLHTTLALAMKKLLPWSLIEKALLHQWKKGDRLDD